MNTPIKIIMDIDNNNYTRSQPCDVYSNEAMGIYVPWLHLSDTSDNLQDIVEALFSSEKFRELYRKHESYMDGKIAAIEEFCKSLLSEHLASLTGVNEHNWSLENNVSTDPAANSITKQDKQYIYLNFKRAHIFYRVNVKYINESIKEKVGLLDLSNDDKYKRKTLTKIMVDKINN